MDEQNNPEVKVTEDAAAAVEPVAEPVPSVEPVAEEPATDATLVAEKAPAADNGSEGVKDEPNNEGNTDFTNNEPVVDTPANEDPVVDENAEKYALLESENAELKNKLSELETKFSDLNTEYEKLVAFKAGIEEAEKDAMIAKFAMLSEEDKADVIANKSKYTVEDIESKLSVICVRKKVNFDSLDNSKINNNMNGQFTYTMSNVSTDVPAWVQAVKNNKK